MGEASSPVHDELYQFKNLIHQEDDGENHQTDKENRQDLFKKIKGNGFSLHFFNSWNDRIRPALTVF